MTLLAAAVLEWALTLASQIALIAVLACALLGTAAALDRLREAIGRFLFGP